MRHSSEFEDPDVREAVAEYERAKAVAEETANSKEAAYKEILECIKKDPSNVAALQVTALTLIGSSLATLEVFLLTHMGVEQFKLALDAARVARGMRNTL